MLRNALTMLLWFLLLTSIAGMSLLILHSNSFAQELPKEASLTSQVEEFQQTIHSIQYTMGTVGLDIEHATKQTMSFITQELISQKLDYEMQLTKQITAERTLNGVIDYERLIRQRCSQYGCNAALVIQVMYCESTANPHAQNYVYYGLFQHDINEWPARAARYGVPGAPITDAYAQIHVTTQMFAQGFHNLWSCA